MAIPACLEHIKDFIKCKAKSLSSPSKVNDQEDFSISCERTGSSGSAKSRSNSMIKKSKTNIYEEIQKGSLSGSSCSLTRSSKTFKSDQPMDSVKIVESKESEQIANAKCIHQMHPECLNLSDLFLEDGSCLVCNALVMGSREFEVSSFREASNGSNESVHREDANQPTEEPNARTDVKKIELKRTLSSELIKLTRIGWYWGKLSRFDAEEKLIDKAPGTFLIRDSFDTNYLLSLSFKIGEGVFHTRIEYQNGLFHFYLHPNKTYETVPSLVDDLILNSQTGIYYYVRSKKSKQEVRFTIKLDQPLSRFSELKSLKHLCRFTLREAIRFDQIERLPLPDAIKVYLRANHL